MEKAEALLYETVKLLTEKETEQRTINKSIVEAIQALSDKVIEQNGSILALQKEVDKLREKLK